MTIFVLGYEIDKVVECAKCHQEMYIPKGWASTPHSTGYGPASDGNQCLACGRYICSNCVSSLHSGQFKCCHDVVKGVSAICYFSSSDAIESQRTEREQTRKSQSPIHVKHEEREEKRSEWMTKAKELKEQGQFDKAIEYLDLIISANLDSNGWAHHYKGSALVELDRYEEAAEYLKQSLKIDPESDLCQFDLGRALYELGNWEEARSNFEKLARGTFVYGVDEKAKEWLKKIETKT